MVFLCIMKLINSWRERMSNKIFTKEEIEI